MTNARSGHGRTTSGRFRRLSLLAAVALAVSPLLTPDPAAPAQAGAEGAALTGFEQVGDLVVEIDGKEWPRAEVFASERARAYLVLAAVFQAPVMIELPTRQVWALDLMKVNRKTDGSIDLLADPRLAPQGSFQLGAGSEMSFRAEGRSVRMKPKPWLLGPQTVQAMLDYNAEYARRARNYVPAVAAVEKLKQLRSEVEVRIYFGSWCPHCKENVPLVLRLAQELAGSSVKFEFYGLPSPFAAEPEAARWDITAVPSGIVLVGGKEIGRVPATGWARPETAILSLLTNAGLTR